MKTSQLLGDDNLDAHLAWLEHCATMWEAPRGFYTKPSPFMAEYVRAMAIRIRNEQTRCARCGTRTLQRPAPDPSAWLDRGGLCILCGPEGHLCDDDRECD